MSSEYPPPLTPNLKSASKCDNNSERKESCDIFNEKLEKNINSPMSHNSMTLHRLTKYPNPQEL